MFSAKYQEENLEPLMRILCCYYRVCIELLSSSYRIPIEFV